MGRLVIRGLLTRKLRSVLTALAIVLGVAMISGTFVLTDQISGAFDDIFQAANKGTDAVVKPNGGVRLRRPTARRAARRCPSRSSRASSRFPASRGRRRARPRTATSSSTASSSSRRAAPRRSSRPTAPDFRVEQARRRGASRAAASAASARARASTSGSPIASTSRSAQKVAGRDRDRAAPRARLGDHQVPRVDRAARRIMSAPLADDPEVVRQAGPAQRDPRRGADPGISQEELAKRVARGGRLAAHRGQDRRQGRDGPGRRHQRRDRQLPDARAARVRRDRRVRRRVHHLQHVLDHGRAAAAGVRDAAHARREPPSGAAGRDRRGARDRRRSRR